MKLVIPLSLSVRFIDNLREANDREIGGVLFAEQKAYSEFHLLDATFQMIGGDTYSFERDGEKAQKNLRRLHRCYSGTPQRFNYFGEWHSHPHSAVIPSHVDTRTMWQILHNTDETVNFIVLLIVKLVQQSSLDTGATVFLRSGHKYECTIVFETNEKRKSND